MPYEGKFQVFEDIIQEMMVVYQHDRRPWLIGYSGGKDSTLLVSLAYEAITRLPPEARTKKVYIITSDTLVENPIVKRYMHDSSIRIGRSAKHHLDEDDIPRDLNIESHIIYPDWDQTFWSRVIGFGYPTPEPPGFRWCTERLKIAPMNRFVDERIKESGEIVILLGVRKAESATRNRTITAREIEGKLLNMHSDIKNAYVYNPITEVHNDLVWEFLLKDDAKSPWGSDMKYLFNLYQGENLGEEQSVIGQIDKDKIPVTGNSRFGCWCCTIVKEDKSLLNFIKKGATELEPLRKFRDWLVSIRQDPAYRDTKRRDGTIYYKSNGEVGFGPFTMWGRQQILKGLLELQRDTQMELIRIEELKVIDQIWDNEGDLSKRMLVDTYYEVFGERLPWDPYKEPLFDDEGIAEIHSIAQEYDLPEELVTKLIVTVEKNKHITRNSRMQKEFDKVMQQEWIHFDAIRDGMNNENN